MVFNNKIFEQVGTEDIMKFFTENTKFDGVCVIYNDVFEDSRGSIWTSYNKEIHSHLLKFGYDFSHDKFNQNRKNVLRGIHYDYLTAKLVTCISGRISQFIVKVDSNKSDFGEYLRFDIDGGSGKSVLIPPGYGNAFVARDHNTIYHYKLAYPSEYIDQQDQKTVAWNDPRLKINWDIDDPILSERDA